jgi:hypothetical protein
MPNLEERKKIIQTNSFIILTCPTPVLLDPGLRASGLIRRLSYVVDSHDNATLKDNKEYVLENSRLVQYVYFITLFSCCIFQNLNKKNIFNSKTDFQ